MAPAMEALSKDKVFAALRFLYRAFLNIYILNIYVNFWYTMLIGSLYSTSLGNCKLVPEVPGGLFPFLYLGMTFHSRSFYASILEKMLALAGFL